MLLSTFQCVARFKKSDIVNIIVHHILLSKKCHPIQLAPSSSLSPSSYFWIHHSLSPSVSISLSFSDLLSDVIPPILPVLLFLLISIPHATLLFSLFLILLFTSCYFVIFSFPHSSLYLMLLCYFLFSSFFSLSHAPLLFSLFLILFF